MTSKTYKNATKTKTTRYIRDTFALGVSTTNTFNGKYTYNLRKCTYE